MSDKIFGLYVELVDNIPNASFIKRLLKEEPTLLDADITDDDTLEYFDKKLEKKILGVYYHNLFENVHVEIREFILYGNQMQTSFRWQRLFQIMILLHNFR